MRILDSRRLTGPNLQMPVAGVIAEVEFAQAALGTAAGVDGEAEISAWREELLALAAALPMQIDRVQARRFSRGAALGFSAPIDRLLTASDLNDLAIARANDRLAGKTIAPLEEALAPLAEAIAKEANPRLLLLEEETARRGLPLIWDDSEVTIGMGARARTYPLRALPERSEIPWSELARIPLALITGTNGKTTSARLLAHLLSQSGKRVGLAATDYVAIAGEIVERGDFTGPAAARMVLRDPRVEVAVLETARGGILRRGLAIDRADCALITNIADDHLGEYGIDSVATLARAKGVVARAVRTEGRIVLNADDPMVVKLSAEMAESFAAPIIWFSLDATNDLAKPLLARHFYRGGEAFLLENGELVRQAGHERTSLLLAREVPISFGGAALYNIANALAAAALAFALGSSHEEIVRGLKSFRPDAKHNPGRGNLYAGPRGAQVLIDFGHNAHGVHHIARLVAGLRGQRSDARELHGENNSRPLTTIAACAGDRSDENLRALAAELAAMNPRRIFLRDLPDYLRGRAPGEVPAKLRELLLTAGMPADSIELRASEADALAHALETAEENELVLVLVHLEEEPVAALLERNGFL